ncbi:MAG: Fic family protein [Acidimicrobiaceae bacterium]|nr:Fic family protein [Acidimicrobiaceae bacterium]
MDSELVGHHWAPIADLAEADREAASGELPALKRTWDDVRDQLDGAQVDRFNERLKREWAIETGIIERIYTLDHGTTQLLIEQGIDASLIANDASDQPPELVAGIIKDHAETVDWLFDAVTEERPLSTSFVKQLHNFMTRKQESATGFDSLGHKRDVKLQHGAFKEWPNNPTRPDGKVHQYCPPEHVASEMDRLIELHQSHRTTDVAPDVSAAWLHHRFTQIHPFQDGNGRVARAIASLVLISAGWFPLVVTRDDRSQYIETLGSADEGDLVPLTNLIAKLQRTQFLRALSIAEEVQSQDQQLEQMLEVIGEMFSGDSAPASEQLQQALNTAGRLWDTCESYFADTAAKLQSSLGNSNARKAWSDSGENSDTDRRKWNRYQIVQTARELDYFANTRDHHEWVRLAIDTENGRSEILTSFHAIGTEYRGLVGVSMCFYRRQQADDVEQQIIELQPVSEELFQINYQEPADSVEERFKKWLERSLVLGLDQWRRGE